MMNNESLSISLEHFEGPLDFLLHLIQKNEIDIYHIIVGEIINQFWQKWKEADYPQLNEGTDFIHLTATLLLLKSRMLLPKHDQQDTNKEEEIDPHFDIIYQLLDYCRFKEVAKELSEREQQQSGFFSRGAHEIKPQFAKTLGIEHLSLEDLANLFQKLLEKSNANQQKVITQDVWRVSDLIIVLRKLINEQEKIAFIHLFSLDKCRQELIVTFLAMLELMKLGELCVAKEVQTQEILIIKNWESNG